eukprot:1340939-Amphidinium_carterae.2
MPFLSLVSRQTSAVVAWSTHVVLSLHCVLVETVADTPRLAGRIALPSAYSARVIKTVQQNGSTLCFAHTSLALESRF